MNLRLVVVASVGIVLSFVNVGNGSAALGLGLLSPLLPIATITGHAGLFGSGLTGAALLKLKAASTLATLFGLAGNGFHIKLGHGYVHEPQFDDYAHGHYRGGHGGGWHRRRRSAEGGDARGETGDLDLAQFDPSLDEVLSYDQLGCGMRLVCELAAAPQEQLADDAKLILELFGRDGKAPNPAKDSRGKLSYSYASILGENAKDASACSRVYARCPYDAGQIMTSLRTANV